MTEFVANHPILVIGWVGSLVGIIYTYIADRVSGIEFIGNNLVAVLTDTQNAVVLDIRPDLEFRKGHITGSHHVTTNDINQNNLGKIEHFKDRPIILVDKDGVTVLDNGKKLRKLGFSKVYVLKDGLTGWSMDNLPLVKK